MVVTLISRITRIIHSRWLKHGWPELLLLIKEDIHFIHPPGKPQQNLNKQALREYETKTDRTGDGLLTGQWFRVLLKSQIQKALRFDKAYRWQRGQTLCRTRVGCRYSGCSTLP